jgi:hypothetical protein
VKALNRSGLRYMLTGALASSYYGRPRTTVDLDVVIAIEQRQVGKLARALKDAGLTTDETKLDSTRQSDHKIARLEDRRSPHSLDLIFANEELERKAGTILGLPTFYQKPESLILAKLRVMKATISPERIESDREDIRHILKFTKINLGTLREKARAESTLDTLEELIRMSQKP